MSSKDAWAAALFAAAVTVLVGIALLLQARYPTAATHDWERVLGFIGACNLVNCAALVIVSRHGRPRLVIGRPTISQRSILPASMESGTVAMEASPGTVAAGVDPSTSDPFFVQLCVWNGELGSHAAENVRVTFDFFTPGAGALYEDVRGRWTESPLDVGMPSSPPPDLRGNGKPHEFCVAMTFPLEAECYVVNDDNRFASSEWRYRPLGLADRQFVILVATASSAHAEVSSYWSLAPGGRGLPPVFVPYHLTVSDRFRMAVSWAKRSEGCDAAYHPDAVVTETVGMSSYRLARATQLASSAR